MKNIRIALAFLFLATLFVQGCASTSSDCTQPQVFCAGLVTEVGRRDDHAYNQAAWEGLQQAKTNGIANWVASIETVDARDYEANIQVFADAGYDAIVTVGSGMADATRSAAQSYPDTYFIGIDQDQTSIQEFSQNLSGLVFPEDQIGFLAGALAAWLTETGQVGAICGSDSLGPMLLYGEGFKAGVLQARPDVTASVIYHNEVSPDKSLDDPAWGAETANTLVEAGADIVFAVNGSTGSNAIVTAVMRGSYAIGADNDQYYALPVAAPHLYASVMKLIGSGVADLLGQAKEAQAGDSVFPTGNYIGQIGLSPYHDLDSSVPDEVKADMVALYQGLLSGEITTGISATSP